MKKLILIVSILLVTSFAFADEVQIPFTCYPKEIQKSFAKHGYKLDLSANDRTDEVKLWKWIIRSKSWGFIINKGSSYYICTYKSITPEEFKIITNVIWGR